jgi:hypothetical protein
MAMKQRRSNPEIHDLWIASFLAMTTGREKACCKDIAKSVIANTRFVPKLKFIIFILILNFTDLMIFLIFVIFTLENVLLRLELYPVFITVTIKKY